MGYFWHHHKYRLTAAMSATLTGSLSWLRPIFGVYTWNVDRPSTFT